MDHKYIKGILLGNTGVGKTSFIFLKYDQIEFANYISLFIKNDISLRLYDTAGQEHIRKWITSDYLHNSHIIFFMTTCCKDTYESDDEQLIRLMNDVKQKVSTPYIPIFILNKVDLVGFDDDIPIEENYALRERIDTFKKIIQEVDLPYTEPLHLFITSCKTHYNVEEVIEEAYDLAIEKFGQIIREENGPVPRNNDDTINEKCNC